MSERQRRARLNILTSLLNQAVTMVCGLIIPRLMLTSFGSEAYGATTSIAQFLSYITLLEGGVCGVARAALYKPLVERDSRAISGVVADIRRFFRAIAYVFVVYTLLLAASYKSISRIQCLDWLSSAALVVVISLSIFTEYFIGISYDALLQADQKTYVTQTITVMSVVLNAVMMFVLIRLGCGLILVKLASGIVFSLKPFLLWLYVRRHYRLEPVPAGQGHALQQKWDALAQHLAYFLHCNIDVFVLTLMSNLTQVAVYGVHTMVISKVERLASASSAGMEAMFGEQYARGDRQALNRIFGQYETLISAVSLFIFGVCAVMLVPFVRLYTAHISDADYIAPVFALLMVLGSLLTMLRSPCHSMVIAAGHFRQTRWAAFGEAIINVTLSVILVWKLGLVGVAIGTVAAVLFRFVYYMVYLSRHIIHRPARLFVRRCVYCAAVFAAIVAAGTAVCAWLGAASPLHWVLTAIAVSVVAGAVLVAGLVLFYREDSLALFGMLRRRLSRR